MVARGEGIVTDFGKVMCTLLYLTWIINKSQFYSTWNSAQYYMPAWMRGRFEGEWIHVYVWLSPFAVHLKLPQHCWSAMPPNKISKFKFWKKKRSCHLRIKTVLFIHLQSGCLLFFLPDFTGQNSGTMLKWQQSSGKSRHSSFIADLNRKHPLFYH